MVEGRSVAEARDHSRAWKIEVKKIMPEIEVNTEGKNITVLPEGTNYWVEEYFSS